MMTKNDDIYRNLQKHLNRQPVGYPKTISGVELKVLKHIFTEEEALSWFSGYRKPMIKNQTIDCIDFHPCRRELMAAGRTGIVFPH